MLQHHDLNQSMMLCLLKENAKPKNAFEKTCNVKGLSFLWVLISHYEVTRSVVWKVLFLSVEIRISHLLLLPLSLLNRNWWLHIQLDLLIYRCRMTLKETLKRREVKTNFLTAFYQGYLIFQVKTTFFF